MALGIAWIDELRAQWSAALADYRVAVANLDAAESALYASYDIAAADPVDLEEWQAHYARVNAIKSTTEAAANVASTVSSWWNSFTDTFGLSGAKRKGLASSAGLGNIAIPAAVLSVTAFVALVARISLIASAITAFVTYLIAKRDTAKDIGARANQIMNDSAQAGRPVSAAEASQIAMNEATAAAQSSTGYSFITGLNRVLMIAALLVAGIFVVPKLLERR